MKAFMHIGEYVPKKPFPVWLFSIARNALIDEKRRQGFSGSVDWDLVPDGSAGPESRVLGQVGFDELLTSVPIAGKLLLELRIIQNLSFGDISQILGESEGSLRVRFHRIMSQLRLKISKEVQG